jgi:DNA-binding transcriptional ArsR family regulator
MADREFVLAPKTVTVTVALEPVYNILDSMMALSFGVNYSGLDEWVYRTIDNLSPERKHINKLVCDGFGGVLVPPLTNTPADFPAFIDYLAGEDPLVLRDRALDDICELTIDVTVPRPEREQLLADVEVYLNYIEAAYRKKYAEKMHEHTFEPDFFREVHALLNKPQEMQQLIVNHLRDMWHEVLEPEWQRVRPILQDAVDAFQQLDYSGLTVFEAIRAVTGRDMRGMWEEYLTGAEQLIFIPSVHTGPYITRFGDDPAVVPMIFGARLPEGARVISPALSRSELLVRLSALADDTRLRILELMGEHDELCAQDIITMLDLSQSAASRHLRLLTATGYLIERRQEVSKCYSLNHERVNDTSRALKRFMM